VTAKPAQVDAEGERDAQRSTLAFYELHAREYFDRTVGADLESLYDRFFASVKPGGRVLDLGSGSGRDLKVMRERGFDPLGIDGAPSLVKLAAEFSGANCVVMRFEDLSFDDEFDGAWACASLLHLPKRELPLVLKRVFNALTEDGAFFLSVKVGDGETVLPDGRRFSYYRPLELHRLLEEVGFCVDQSWLTDDSLRPQRTLDWLNVVAKRIRG
jgi:SAM-dependent methyltransferase